MTNRIPLVAAMLVLMASAASAQCGERRTPEQVAAARSERYLQSTMGAAFTGITLTAAQDTAARETIRNALEGMRAIGGTVEARPSLNERVRVRDANLEALLTSSADTATFEQNTKGHTYKPVFVLDCP